MANRIRKLDTKGRFDLLKTVYTLLEKLGIKALVEKPQYSFEYRDRICTFTLWGSRDVSTQVVYRPEIDANTCSQLTITVYGDSTSREVVITEGYDNNRLSLVESNEFYEWYKNVARFIESALDYKYGTDGPREHFNMERWLREVLNNLAG